MAVTRKLARVKIPIGKNAQEPIRRMVRYMNRRGADAVSPFKVECVECKLKWEVCRSADLRTVSCSNCYGDNVRLVVVKLEFSKQENPNE